MTVKTPSPSSGTPERLMAMSELRRKKQAGFKPPPVNAPPNVIELHGRPVRHLKDFRLGMPAHRAICLGDLINAGWLRHAELVETAGAALSNQLDNLNEIVLKSIEVLEYRRRVEQ
jgi:hypothetical protein